MCTQYSLLKYINLPPTKVKGKCTTAMYTMLHDHTKIPSAAFNLAPHSKTTTFCLSFCLHPSSMLSILYNIYSLDITVNLAAEVH